VRHSLVEPLKDCRKHQKSWQKISAD